MKLLAPIFMLLTLVMSGCYDSHNAAPSEPFSERANTPIGKLRGLCEGEECYSITEDRVCVGRITSSDKEGNFYRSITVEDESGGVEIKVGGYNLAVQYPVGLMVALRLDGTALATKNGVVQMGLPPQSFDSSPREIESQEVIDRHIVRSSSIEGVAPMICDIGMLDTSLCGRFVRIENIRYAPIEQDTPTEHLRFVDRNDNAIYIYISSYADFADLEFHEYEYAIQGILYYELISREIGNAFVLKPRFANDFSSISTAL